MNILFLTSTFPRFQNDSQAPFVLEQATAWKKAQPQNQFFILAPHDQTAKKREQLNSINIHRFCYWWPSCWQKLTYPAILPNIKRNPFLLLQLPFFLFFQLLNALIIIKKLKIDLIYVHWVMPQGLTSYLTNRILNTPYVLQNHSSDLKIFKKIPIIGKFLARRIIFGSKKLFCVNSLLKSEVLTFFKQENQPEINAKITTLPMGIACQSDPNNTVIGSQSKYTFGFIGRLTKKKGVDFFIAAIRQLRAQNAKFSAAIAGNGEEMKNLKKSATGLDIDFLGFVSDHKKTTLFNQTKFLVFPSIISKGDVEGLPVTLLEALYLGKIVIASKDTNIEFLPEWNSIREAVYFLPDPKDIENFKNLMYELMSLDSNTIKAKTDKSRKAIEKYHWNNLIHEYISSLE